MSALPVPEYEIADEETRRVLSQIRRLVDVGFLMNWGQKSRAGQREYVLALSDLPDRLLILAIERVIRERRDKFFPLPGEIRAAVEPELRALGDLRRERLRNRVVHLIAP